MQISNYRNMQGNKLSLVYNESTFAINKNKYSNSAANNTTLLAQKEMKDKRWPDTNDDDKAVRHRITHDISDSTKTVAIHKNKRIT